MEKLIGEVNKEQIGIWKKEHGKVFGIKVGGHIGYVRKATRVEVAYSSTIAQTNPIKSNEALLKSIWLGGSEAIKTDDELFYGASLVLAGLVQVKEAELINF